MAGERTPSPSSLKALGTFQLPTVPSRPMGTPGAAERQVPAPPPGPLSWFAPYLEGAVDVPLDLLRGAFAGFEGPEDSAAAKFGELAGALPKAGPLGAVLGVPKTALRHFAPETMQMLVDFARRGKTPLHTLEESLLGGQAYASLADTIVPGATAGEYVLKPEVQERLRDLYKLGTSLADQSVWAGATDAKLLEAFGGDKDAALMWSRMFASTSPRTSVPKNTMESVRAWLRVLEQPGEIFTDARARQMGLGNVGSKVDNLNRSLWNLALSPGTKVEAFAGYMAGLARIPIDVHALYALTGSAATLDKQMPALRVLMAKAEGLPLVNRGGTGLSKVDVYMRYEEALKKALGNIAPGEELNKVFGQLWEGTRAYKGQKPQGGAIDILREKGLLEVGAMLDPVALRRALRQKSWTAHSIAGLFAALGLTLPAATEPGEAGEDGSPAPNVGAVTGAPNFVQ